MIDAVLELPDRTEVPWRGEEFLPRKGDHIFWDDKRYGVIQVQWYCESRPTASRTASLQIVRILVALV